MPISVEPRAAEKVHSLVRLLRSRSSEEIRERMYDNPPGTVWWTACKTELDLRNGRSMATAAVDTSRVLDKMRSSTEHLDQMSEQLLHATEGLADLVKSTNQSARRMELATYVIVAVAIMQVFYMAFQILGKR
jgi:hypothetical protein